LRLPQLYTHHHGDPFAHIFAGQVLIILLEPAAATGIRINAFCEGCLEAGEMAPAFNSVYIVGKGIDCLHIARVPLHCHFDFHVLLGLVDIDRIGMESVLVLIQMGDKRADAPFIAELVLL